MAQAQDQDVLLETVEEEQDQIQSSHKVRY